MLNATSIPSARVPLIDERTGLVSREWFAYFQNLFYLTGGGGNDTTLTEVQYPPAPDVAETLSSMPLTPDEVAPSLLGVAPVLDPAIGLSVETLASLLAATEAMAVAPVINPVMPNIAVDYIDFNSPVSVTLKAGRIWWDSTGTLNIGMGNGLITQQVGEEFFQYGKASAAISDVNVQLVYKTGVVGASGAITFAPAIAGITDPDLMVGISTEPLLLNAFGRVTTMGTVRGLNTSGSVYGETWADNDDIWYNPVSGGLTKTKPVAPNLKLQIGTVIRAGSGGSGVFSVRIAGSSVLGGTDANVQLGALLDKQLLQYDAIAGYWKNVGLASIGSTAAETHAATPKTIPADADEIPLVDSASTFSLKKLTWANLKATLATWLDTGLIPAYFTALRAVGKITASGPIETSGSTGGSYGVSRWFIQQEEPAVVRSYACGNDAGTFGVWKHYAAYSNGGPTLAFTVSSTGMTLPGALLADTIQPTSANGYKSNDGSLGITTVITTASLVGKTITIKDGIITSFA